MSGFDYRDYRAMRTPFTSEMTVDCAMANKIDVFSQGTGMIGKI